MKRIGLDVHCVGLRQTGNETYTYNLATQLAHGGYPWDLVRYYTTASDAPDLRHFIADAQRVRPAHPLLRIPLGFPWVLLRDRISLAHFQYVSPPVAPCPVVLTVHDISYEAHPEYFSTPLRKRMQWLVPGSIRRAAHTLTVSEFTRTQICERYGIAPERVTVTPNGVSEKFRRLAPEAMRAATNRFGLPRPFVLGVGNLQPRKNFERLIEAYAMASRQIGDIDLVLVGQATWGAKHVAAQIERMDLTGRVHLLGYVSPEAIVGLYNSALAFAFPSLYEGFGLPVLEAMACGAPVLTSNSSALPEIAGNAALLVDPFSVEAIADGLTRLVTDAALRQELILRGYQRAQLYSWERTARLTAAVYQDYL
jgi:glycosyltransferase involved in cell wall biosynthesis